MRTQIQSVRPAQVAKPCWYRVRQCARSGVRVAAARPPASPEHKKLPLQVVGGLAALALVASPLNAEPAWAGAPKFNAAAVEREQAIEKEMAVLEALIEQQATAKKAAVLSKRQQFEADVAKVESRIDNKINEEKAIIAASMPPVVTAPPPAAAPVAEPAAAPVEPAPAVVVAAAAPAAPASPEEPSNPPTAAVVAAAGTDAPTKVAKAEVVIARLEQEKQELEVYAAKVEAQLDRQVMVVDAQAAAAKQDVEATAQVIKDDLSDKIDAWLDSLNNLQ